MNDAQAEQLLELLAMYAEDESAEVVRGMTVDMLAVDLAMSMDVTSDRADRARQIIEEAFTE